MVSSSLPSELRQKWHDWMHRYAETADRFLAEPFPAQESETAEELNAIKTALYARALTVFDTTRLLLQADRQLDGRIHSRAAIEAAMYLLALDRDPSFVEKMKADDHKSRHARASLYLKADRPQADPEVLQLLEDFVNAGDQGAKMVSMGHLLKGSEFERLYRTYRDLSADSAHVSITSLARHFIEGPDGVTTLVVHPALDTMEFALTYSELCIAMNVATLVLMKAKARTDLWDEFSALLQGYNELWDQTTAVLVGLEPAA